MGLDKWEIIVVGSNHAWGRGSTLSKALSNASRPKHYVAYLCHPDTTVSSFDGSLVYPAANQPKLIEEKMPKKARQTT